MSATIPAPAAPRAQPPRPHPLPLHRGDRRRRRSASPSACSLPDFAVQLKPLGTAFVALIKMMIQPVIFCTIVLGVGSVAQRRPGRQGRRPRAGLLPGDVDRRAGDRPGRRQPAAPGLGPAPDRRVAERRRRAGRRAPARTTDFLLGIIPTSLFSALTSGEVLQTLLVALLVGFALQAMGRSGEPVLRGVEHLQRAGLPGAGDDHVGRAGRRVRRHRRRRRRDRRGRAEEPGGADGRLLHHLLRSSSSSSSARCSRWSPASTSSACFKYLGREFLLILSTSSSESALPRLIAKMEHAGVDKTDRRRRGADRLLVQPRRHRDLPDDGVAVHRRGAGRPAEHRRADLAAACS